MGKIEYKVLRYKAYDILSDAGLSVIMEREFTKLASDGWEMFDIVTTSYGQYNNGIILYHFRRQVKD